MTVPQTGDSSRSGAISGGVSADPVSQVTEPLCQRCGRPTGRTARHAIYCLDCMVTQHLARRRAAHEKQRGGSRDQYERVLALWRDGTLRRVLEAVE